LFFLDLLTMTTAPAAAPVSARERLAHLPAHLSSRIRGQPEVIGRVAAVLQRAELGLTKPGRPKASFLFLGPTGVGKTELTLCFSDYLLGRGSVHRFDMSEYQNQNAVGLLLGEHLGERGLLGAAIDRCAEATLLFDEIEKAHPRVLDLFLQMLDAARATLADGSTLDLSRCYIVMTSNLGSAEIMGLHHSAYATMERHVLTRAQQSLRPELYARLTEKLVFNRLSYDVQVEIARLRLEEEIAFYAARGHRLGVDEDVLNFLVRVGYHPRLGARPLRDAVERLVGDAVATALLAGGDGSGELRLRAKGNGLHLGG
jgi:ATP-dependent Clp protease ATP-binding subunit ClpA